MPPDPVSPGSPGDWLRHARADLALAQVEVSPQLLELLCFHAQQACEKSLKAVLVYFGVAVPKTHNLRALVDLISKYASVPMDIAGCAELTDYAVTTRYPGVYEPVTENEHREAVQTADQTIRWVETLVGAGMTP
ncbi:MAG: HEPN domain-containing protein [Pirellulales bacterium]